MQPRSVRFDFGRALYAFVAQWKCRLFLPARSGVQISPKAPTSSSRWLRVSVSDADAPCSIHGEETSKLPLSRRIRVRVYETRRPGSTPGRGATPSSRWLRALAFEAGCRGPIPREGSVSRVLAAQGTISYVVVRQFNPATRDSLGYRPKARTRDFDSRYQGSSPCAPTMRTWRNGSRASLRNSCPCDVMVQVHPCVLHPQVGRYPAAVLYAVFLGSTPSLRTMRSWRNLGRRTALRWLRGNPVRVRISPTAL